MNITDTETKLIDGKRLARAEKRRNQIIEALETRRANIIAKAEALAKEIRAVAEQPISLGTASNVPRGVLTIAIADALKGARHGVKTADVIKTVAADARVATVPNLAFRVRNTLNASPRFKKVGKSKFKNAGKLDGALFKRLTTELAAK